MEEPILSRIDRLDHLLRELEEIRSGGNDRSASGASTPSSGTLTTSDGHASSSVDFSPRSLEKHCRPMNYVVMETEAKGTLVERLNNVEERLRKMEEEMNTERKRTPEEKARTSRSRSGAEKKGFKRMVKRIVRGKKKHSMSSSDGCL